MVFRIVCLLICASLTGLPAMASGPLPEDLQTITTERYRQALAVDPDNSTLRYYLGVNLLARDQFAEAARELRRAWPAYAKSVEANYNLALALAGSGDSDSALIYLQQAEDLGAAKQPETYPIAAVYYNIALDQLNHDRPQQAAELLEHALQLPGPKTEIHRLLGDIFLRLGDEQRSEAHWLAVLKETPEDPDARDYLYTLRYNRGLELLESAPEQARDQFLAALEVNPEAPLPHYYLAYLAYQKQDCGTTLDQLQQAGDQLPESTRESLDAMAFNCAARLLEQERPELAQRALKLLEASPSSEIQSHFLAGNIHLALKNYEQARNEYLQVLQKDPGHTGATLNLLKADQGTSDRLFEEGRDLYRSGAYLQAIARFEQCLRINPAYPMARDYLEQSRQDLRENLQQTLAQVRHLVEEDPRQALTQIDRGLKLAPADKRLLELRQRATEALSRQVAHLLTDARAQLASGNDRRAEAILRQVLAIAPEHAQARSELEQLLRQRQQHLDRLVRAGDRALEQGDLEAARQAYKAALAEAPDLAPAKTGMEKVEGLVDALVAEHLRNARRAGQTGQLMRAADEYRQALKLRPAADIRRELEALQESGRSRIAKLQQHIEAALARQDLPAARRHLDQLEQLAPDSDGTRQLRERLQARTEERISQLLDAADQHLGQQAYKEALAAYRKALELAPDNPRAQQGLRRVRQTVSERLQTLLGQTDAALEDGQYGRAHELLKQAQALDPYSSALKKRRTRLTLLEKSGLKPEDAPRLYLEGIDLYTRGRYRQAISLWKQVLELNPRHERARSNIAKAQRKLAQIERISQ